MCGTPWRSGDSLASAMSTPIPPRAGRLPRADSALWIALSAAVSGLSTYALLAATAAGVGPRGFDSFSPYWAALLVVAIGGFLPIEQILARHTAAGAGARGVRGWALGVGTATALLGTAGFVLVAWRSADQSVSAPLVAAFVGNLAGVAVQVAGRGVAAGRHRLDAYAAIIVTDAGLRTTACIVLAISGVTEVAAYAGAIAAGAVVSAVLGVVLLARGEAEASLGAVPPRLLTTEALTLVPAMLCMQVLLNSPILLASLGGGAPSLLVLVATMVAGWWLAAKIPAARA